MQKFKIGDQVIVDKIFTGKVKEYCGDKHYVITITGKPYFVLEYRIKKPKPKHGGKRAGSGQKLKYGEPTTTVAFRVPVSKTDVVKDLVNKKLEKWRIRG